MIGDLNIANGFNEFFASVGPELANKFDDIDLKAFEQNLPPCHSAETFTFCKVTEGMVLKFIGEMQSKCSQDPDGVSTKLLKVIISHILSPLTHYFNLSFQQAFVAPQFRSAQVIPVYKSGKKDDYSNYRPISLLSSMCQLQERIVARQLTGYLNKHALLYPLTAACMLFFCSSILYWRDSMTVVVCPNTPLLSSLTSKRHLTQLTM